MSESGNYSKETGKLLPDAPAEMPLPRLPRPPFWMISIGLVAIVATWVPLVLGAMLRSDKKAEPRISLVQDMAVQPRFSTQQTSPIFDDGRAMRPGIVGTVKFDDAEQDDFYFRGFHLVHNTTTNKDEAVFYRGFPPRVNVTSELLQRGQERFNIYCSACHGMDGAGHGPVNERALQLAGNGIEGMNWTPAASLQDPKIMEREEGNIFNTITNGVRNMPSYRGQVPVADRWAIIAYVKALQLSQNAPPSALTPEESKEPYGK